MNINFIYPEKSEIKFHIDTYPDSQKHLVLDSELNLRDGAINVYTRISNMDDMFILLQLSDICMRHGVCIQNVYISYLLGARTDRLFGMNQALDLKIIFDMLGSIHANQCHILELHNNRSILCLKPEIFCVPETIMLHQAKISLDYNPVFLFPDEGAKNRYVVNTFAYSASKVRQPDGTIKVQLPDIMVGQDDQIAVIDDLCDGGGTFFALYDALPENLKSRVHLFVTHAIQHEPICKLAQLYKTVTITNSYKAWEYYEFPDNVKVIKIWDK